MHCLGCTWHTQVDLYGIDAHFPSRRVAFRIGVLTANPDSDPVIAFSSDSDEPVAITPDIVARLVDALQSATTDCNVLVAERDKKHQDNARRVVNAAVLARTQWRDVLDGITRGDDHQRAAAITALKAAAPPQWLDDLPATGR